MRRNLVQTAALALLAVFLAIPAGAQLFRPQFPGPYLPTLAANLGPCTSALENSIYLVSNAASAGVCTGTGTAASLCICDGGSWRAYGASATLASTVTVADAAGDTTTFPLLAGSATGSLPPLTDPGLTYQATTNALTATTFIGALTGNASTATSATTATTASAVPIGAAAPSVCDASTSLGYLYVDTTGPDLCYCPGAGGWLPVDGSGTCA